MGGFIFSGKMAARILTNLLLFSTIFIAFHIFSIFSELMHIFITTNIISIRSFISEWNSFGCRSIIIYLNVHYHHQCIFSTTFNCNPITYINIYHSLKLIVVRICYENCIIGQFSCHKHWQQSVSTKKTAIKIGWHFKQKYKNNGLLVICPLSGVPKSKTMSKIFHTISIEQINLKCTNEKIKKKTHQQYLLCDSINKRIQCLNESFSLIFRQIMSIVL